MPQPLVGVVLPGPQLWLSSILSSSGLCCLSRPQHVVGVQGFMFRQSECAAGLQRGGPGLWWDDGQVRVCKAESALAPPAMGLPVLLCLSALLPSPHPCCKREGPSLHLRFLGLTSQGWGGIGASGEALPLSALFRGHV